MQRPPYGTGRIISGRHFTSVYVNCGGEVGEGGEGDEGAEKGGESGEWGEGGEGGVGGEGLGLQSITGYVGEGDGEGDGEGEVDGDDVAGDDDGDADDDDDDDDDDEDDGDGDGSCAPSSCGIRTSCSSSGADSALLFFCSLVITRGAAEVVGACTYVLGPEGVSKDTVPRVNVARALGVARARVHCVVEAESTVGADVEASVVEGFARRARRARHAILLLLLCRLLASLACL